MANTLTGIIPNAYAGLDIVSREMIGAIPAVQRDATLERVAVGQTVVVPVVPAATGGNITPGSIPPNDGDMTIGTKNVTITKSKYSPFRWNGEEQLAVGLTGQYNKILRDQFAQAFRWLANQVEADIMTAAYQGASRAVGTAGTTPFGTAGDFTDFAGVNKILDDNGAPMTGRHLILGSSAVFNLEGKQSVLFKVNEAGTDSIVRRRIFPELMGFQLGKSAGVGVVTKGTGTGYVVNNSGGYPIGATQITVGTGTGTILAGDVINFAGDPNNYVVNAALAAGVVTIGNPGLLTAVANTTALTVGNNFADNVAFTENALVLAARAPAAPDGGDSAEDMQMVVDPVSGIAFEIRMYKEYRRMRIEVGLAWGVGLVKSEDIAVLRG